MMISVGLNGCFILLFALLMLSGSDSFVDFLLVNGLLQLCLFVVVAVLPYLKTRRISYVDIAWPFGVALIGAQLMMFGDGDTLRRMLVGAVYLFIGLRMGIAAVIMAKKTGVIFKTEFPRYEYRRMLAEKSGTRFVNAHIVLEILAQGLANMTVLALPGLLIAHNADNSVHWLEVFGLALWGVAYIIESVADTQKLLFVSKNESGVCNIGLWRYSRHPNYFAEWLVWTGLVIAAVPSWLQWAAGESLLVAGAAGLGALGASVSMYITLVYLTGAKPAEYYSVRKRAGYADYQQRTNRFFPWFPKASN